jgi:hypothetical protein
MARASRGVPTALLGNLVRGASAIVLGMHGPPPSTTTSLPGLRQQRITDLWQTHGHGPRIADGIGVISVSLHGGMQMQCNSSIYCDPVAVTRRLPFLLRSPEGPSKQIVGIQHQADRTRAKNAWVWVSALPGCLDVRGCSPFSHLVSHVIHKRAHAVWTSPTCSCVSCSLPLLMRISFVTSDLLSKHPNQYLQRTKENR